MDDEDDVLIEDPVDVTNSEQPSNDTATWDDHPARCPIIEERSIGSLDYFRRAALVKARTALVLITATGEYLVHLPEDPPTAGALIRRRVKFMSEVDTGSHLTRIRCELPCEENAFSFTASIDVRWRVSDPRTVVRDGIRNVRAALEPLMLDRLRKVTREHRAEDTKAAEEAVNAALSDIPEIAKLGFDLMASAQLTMDEAVRDRARKIELVNAYQDILIEGELSQFALQLAEKPEAVADVVALLVEGRDAQRSASVELLARLFEAGAIQRWEVSDQVRTALQTLQETTNWLVMRPSDGRNSKGKGKRNHHAVTTDSTLPHRNGKDRVPKGV